MRGGKVAKGCGAHELYFGTTKRSQLTGRRAVRLHNVITVHVFRKTHVDVKKAKKKKNAEHFSLAHAISKAYADEEGHKIWVAAAAATATNTAEANRRACVAYDAHHLSRKKIPHIYAAVFAPRDHKPGWKMTHAHA